MGAGVDGGAACIGGLALFVSFGCFVLFAGLCALPAIRDCVRCEVLVFRACFGSVAVLSFFGDAVYHESDPDEDDEVAQDADGVVVAVELPAAERSGVHHD